MLSYTFTDIILLRLPWLHWVWGAEEVGLSLLDSAKLVAAFRQFFEEFHGHFERKVVVDIFVLRRNSTN